MGRAALGIILKIATENRFQRKKFAVDEFGYPKESIMPRSDMRGSSVKPITTPLINKVNIRNNYREMPLSF